MNIQESYDELVNRSKTTSVSVFAIRFGAGLSLVALKDRPVELFVLWDPLISGAVMYKIFVGPGVEPGEAQHSDNPFALRPQHTGMFQMGLDKEFAAPFLALNDTAITARDIQIIRTETSHESREVFPRSNIRDVNQQCDWLLNDLPVIFSPKLVSAVCGCFQ